MRKKLGNPLWRGIPLFYWGRAVLKWRLFEILKTKAKTVKAESDFEKKRKLAAYAMQKGFKGSLVWEVLKECF